MKDRRLGKVKKILQKKEEFSDLSNWEIEKIKVGNTSPIKLKLSIESTKYFVKLIKDNEKQILKILSSMNSELIPKVIYPDLLDQNILLCQFIDGGTLKNRNLDPELIKNFAQMQNLLNDDIFIKWSKFLDGYIRTKIDNGMFRNYVLESIPLGYDNLLELKKLRLDIVEDFLEIFDVLIKKSDLIAREYAKMPFARQHHDFREDSITRSPQKLVDWGSSYGHGPFLFDLSPFLWKNPKSLKIFMDSSSICRNSNEEHIMRWLFIATCFRFILMCRYFLLIIRKGFKFKQRLEEFFIYNHETYKNLTEQEHWI